MNSAWIESCSFVLSDSDPAFIINAFENLRHNSLQWFVYMKALDHFLKARAGAGASNRERLSEILYNRSPARALLHHCSVGLIRGIETPILQN